MHILSIKNEIGRAVTPISPSQILQTERRQYIDTDILAEQPLTCAQWLRSGGTPSNFVRMSLHDIRVLQGRTKQVVAIDGRVAFIRQILNTLRQAYRDKDVLSCILEYLCCQ